MKLTNLVLFALSSVSVAFGQTAGAARKRRARARVQMQQRSPGWPPGEITSKLTGLTVEIKSLFGASGGPGDGPGDEIENRGANGYDDQNPKPRTKSRSKQHRSSHLADSNNSGGEALKDLVVALEKQVPGVDKEIYRILNVGTIAKLRANGGSVAPVLNVAEVKVKLDV
ncbi:hypothetical protein RhiXN_04685 [Rhizoctonia solani]|uniref:Uncharacterized protein n=1 Tax=Rhizoctonia solani TaxID=456999 RepID=A0A8H8NQ54_9AGAM|nr:uncharacterized protein RhiXN_04685 [Rhizoctonia solani]QRW16683.1 hypothetical protein RhiXN_04685 [Rhizoctonia solani]